MTTANLLNIPSVKSPQVNVSKRLEEEERKVSEIFASMMNQSPEAVPMVGEDTSSNLGVSKTESSNSVADTYERYSYKENQIETAKEDSMTAQEAEAAQEAIEEAENEILDTISEEYGVEKEELQTLLEEMGLTAIDLLNPKNLVSFLIALTGMASGEELLLDDSFLQVMSSLDTVAKDLMQELSVDPNGLADILAQMEAVEEGELSPDFAKDLQRAAQTTETELVTEDVISTDTAVADGEEAVLTRTTGEEVKPEEAEAEQETVSVETKGEPMNDEAGTSGEEELSHNQTERNPKAIEVTLSGTEDGNTNPMLTPSTSTTATAQMTDIPQIQYTSYLGTETIQIMEQLTEQIRVVVKPDTTSMEMQLNPENLGKITLHISSEEGVVNAQFVATNEVVKEALEAQIATLRENLTQAGVKVDAIEVTVESHQFERNLEENNQNRDPEAEMMEKPTRRRNLDVTSLDELSGIMTEEETLVAQMMRDNGNSVDYTA